MHLKPIMAQSTTGNDSAVRSPIGSYHGHPFLAGQFAIFSINETAKNESELIYAFLEMLEQPGMEAVLAYLAYWHGAHK